MRAEVGIIINTVFSSYFNNLSEAIQLNVTVPLKLVEFAA